jgi:hypothetical protein
VLQSLESGVALLQYCNPSLCRGRGRCDGRPVATGAHASADSGLLRGNQGYVLAQVLTSSCICSQVGGACMSRAEGHMSRCTTRQGRCPLHFVHGTTVHGMAGLKVLRVVLFYMLLAG